MASSDEILADSRSALQRVRAEEDTRRIRRSGRAKRALKLAGGGIVAVALAAFVWGLVTPIGVTGVMIAVLAMLAVVILAVMFSREGPVEVAQLPQAPLPALPAKTAQWLNQQRALLPAPARTLADGIGVKLDALVPQLATLNANEPAAHEIRRLIADELPELVRGYERVPEAMRRQSKDGFAPEKQLLDGLMVVDSELTRMSEQLARGDLEKLATQGKYLELKYRGEGLE